MASDTEKLYARDVKILEFEDIALNEDSFVADMRQNIEQGDGYVVRNVVEKEKLQKIRDYLIQVGRHSLPNYHPIEKGCPNFHRLNQFDSRAYVKGCFHQFSFFPWNQDFFNLFESYKTIYHLKNKLSNIPAEKFLSREPDDGCIARLSFQFYPNGCGVLNSHADPVDRHQLTIPLMLMSKKGEDFQEGGGYVVASDGSKLIVDDLGEWGDVFFFNAQVVHGVEAVNPSDETDWLSFRGRWILLFTVNKLADTGDIGDAVDYSKVSNDKVA